MGRVRLEGIHHVTAITADAPANLEFYAGTLGLRLVKKTVNQDDPTVYHLFYADERGSSGADITFFEYPGAPRGRPGSGMVHRVVFRVGSEASLDFWAERAGGERRLGALELADPDGLALELVVDESHDPPLSAQHPGIPPEHALRGFAGVRAYSPDQGVSAAFLHGLGFTPGWECRGEQRGSFYVYDDPPDEPGAPGAGTVHHVAWASQPAEHEAWRERVSSIGGRPTPVIDRFYFRSIYFREPSGVLFEIATIGPGFATDEPADQLGERLSLPPGFEPLRGQLERRLTPLPELEGLR
jgi:glyoxalase family protein